MPKPRSNSLYARLGESRRDQVFEWLFYEGIGYRESAARIKKQFGIKTERTPVCSMAHRHGLAWRMEEAKRRVEAEMALLPEDHEEARKRALAQREYVAVTRDLSFKEVMLAQRLELDRDRLKLQKEMSGRRADLLESKLSGAKEAAISTTLTPEEKERRMKEIFGII